MTYRGNEYDVAGLINTTDVRAVSAEVGRLFEALYQRSADALLSGAFRDFHRFYLGDHPLYHPCDTEYHDIQHVLDVTLAMARLMDGAARAGAAPELEPRYFVFGVITALFHDAGYLRHRKDTRHTHGADYTRTHVSRGSRVLHDYLVNIGMADLAPVGARVIHFTGYERPVAGIRVDPGFRTIGNLLGSADLLAQMADRCYLEKCYQRLYPEFVRGGLAARRLADGRMEVVYGSAAELVYKTAQFGRLAQARLETDLHGDHRRAVDHFGGDHLYWDAMEKNLRFAVTIAAHGDVGLLRRTLPVTLPPKPQKR